VLKKANAVALNLEELKQIKEVAVNAEKAAALTTSALKLWKDKELKAFSNKVG
jgi:hypothetical protein